MQTWPAAGRRNCARPLSGDGDMGAITANRATTQSPQPGRRAKAARGAQGARRTGGRRAAALVRLECHLDGLRARQHSGNGHAVVVVVPFPDALPDPFVDANPETFVYAFLDPFIYAFLDPFIYAFLDPFIYALPNIFIYALLYPRPSSRLDILMDKLPYVLLVHRPGLVPGDAGLALGRLRRYRRGRFGGLLPHYECARAPGGFPRGASLASGRIRAHPRSAAGRYACIGFPLALPRHCHAGRTRASHISIRECRPGRTPATLARAGLWRDMSRHLPADFRAGRRSGGRAAGGQRCVLLEFAKAGGAARVRTVGVAEFD